jgi:hypothetical protein
LQGGASGMSPACSPTSQPNRCLVRELGRCEGGGGRVL